MNQISISYKVFDQRGNIVPYLEEKIRNEKSARLLRDEKLKGVRKFMGITDIRPHVEKTDIKNFLKMTVKDKEKAIETLILNSIVNSPNEKSMAFQLLSSLNYGTMIGEIKTKQRVALVEVLADSVDEMAKLSGSFESKFYNIFVVCEFVVLKIFKSLSAENRWNLLLNILQNGNAKSWVYYIARQIILDHENGYATLPQYSPWLENDNIEKIKEIAIKKLPTIIEQSYDSSSDPLQLFLLYIQFGREKDKDWLRGWVKERTSDNKEFVKFVEHFTGIATVYNEKISPEEVKIAFTQILNSIINTDIAVNRLRDISNQKDEVGKKALELLQIFEYTSMVIKKGLKISSYYC